MSHKLLISMFSCWLAVAASARALVVPPPVEEQVNAYIMTDQPVAAEQILLSRPDSDAVMDTALNLLDTAGISAQARNRLWKLLASARGDYGATQITRDERIAALAEALIHGSNEAKLAVIQRIAAVQPSKRAGIVEIVNNLLPSAADPQIVAAGLFSLAMTRSLSDETKPYVEGLVSSLNNANEDLKEALSIRAIANPDVFVGSNEKLIRTAAIAARVASASTVDDALAYIATFDPGVPSVLDAMVMVGNSENILHGADYTSRVAWMEEYSTRFCAPGCQSHREKFSLSYLSQLRGEFADMATAVLQAVGEIDLGCATTVPRLPDAIADFRELWAISP